MANDDGVERYRGRIFEVWEHRRPSPTGGDFTVSLLRCPDWVNVIPVGEGAKVLMIRQLRHGSGKFTWEFPGGNVDPREHPEAAALRELEEETGWTAARLVHLGSVNPNPAFLTNTLHCYAAFDLAPLGTKRLDEHEATEECFWEWEEVRKRLGGPEFDHGIMLCTAWFFLRWLEKGGGLPG